MPGETNESGTDYLALARLLTAMTPMQRRMIWLSVKIMKSKTLRALIVVGTISALMLVVALAAQSNVSPFLAWALVIAGGLVTLVIILKIFKIL